MESVLIQLETSITTIRNIIKEREADLITIQKPSPVIHKLISFDEEKEPLGNYSKIDEGLFENKYGALEHSIGLLRESIHAVQQAAGFTNPHMNFTAKSLITSRKSSRLKVDPSELVIIDKELGHLYSVQLMLELSNVYAILPVTREFQYIFGYTYIAPICFSVLFLGALLISYLMKLQRFSQGRLRLFVSLLYGLLFNVLLIYSINIQSAWIAVFSL